MSAISLNDVIQIYFLLCVECYSLQLGLGVVLRSSGLRVGNALCWSNTRLKPMGMGKKASATPISIRNYVQCLVRDPDLVHARSICQAGNLSYVPEGAHVIASRPFDGPQRSVKSVLMGYHNPKYALSTHRPTLKPSRDMMYPTNSGNRGARRSSVRMRKGRAVEGYIITSPSITVIKTYH
jgi:hypothetical protein